MSKFISCTSLLTYGASPYDLGRIAPGPNKLL